MKLKLTLGLPRWWLVPRDSVTCDVTLVLKIHTSKEIFYFCIILSKRHLFNY